MGNAKSKRSSWRDKELWPTIVSFVVIVFVAVFVTASLACILNTQFQWTPQIPAQYEASIAALVGGGAGLSITLAYIGLVVGLTKKGILRRFFFLVSVVIFTFVAIVGLCTALGMIIRAIAMSENNRTVGWFVWLGLGVLAVLIEFVFLVVFLAAHGHKLTWTQFKRTVKRLQDGSDDMYIRI